MDPIPAVERAVGVDLVKHAALVAPGVLLAAGVLRGLDGIAGAGVGLGLVTLNFLAGALSLGWATRRGESVLMGVALGGFLVRMIAIAGVVALVKDRVDFASLAVTLLATHLGLLVWETQRVSISLAAPGLKPSAAPKGRNLL